MMSALAMTYEGMNSSALEHSVPEQMFSTPENPVYGVSAVKAIQIAASQGIPIYTVTRENADTVISQLSLDAATIQEIKNAVNAGGEVTVSRTNINFHGWIGCGYIVMNPVTGTGAYMISGQESGGWVRSAFDALQGIFFFIGFIGSLVALPVIASVVIPVLLSLIFNVLESVVFDDFNATRIGVGTSVGIGIGALGGTLLNLVTSTYIWAPLMATPIGFILFTVLITITLVGIHTMYALSVAPDQKVEMVV